jgi:zinc/manganese transport system substrate-binding protein
MTLLACCRPASAALNIFACVPEWASLAKELGGDKINVYQASNALQDPHRIEARPSLIARMRQADLLVCTGAELEVGWLPVLLQTAGNAKVQPGSPGHFMAADQVSKLEVPTSVDRSMGDVHPAGNPHIHLDPHNIAKVATALTARLSQVDASNAPYYEARGQDFQRRWKEALVRWEKESASLKGVRVIAHHKDMVYLFHWLDLKEVMNIEPKPGIPPSAGHLGELLAKLKSEQVQLITRGAYNDAKASAWLGERSGVPVVELPYTVGGTPEAKDLFGLFDDSIARLKKSVK